MVVLSIIGLLVVLAIPAVAKARLRAANGMFVNDLRLLSHNVFEYYAVSKGDYPPDAPAGVAPPEVADLIPRRINWSRGTPIGGQWDWDRAATHDEQVRGCCYAGLSVLDPARTSGQMKEIDAILDDGDLGTGRFRAHPQGYVFISE
jgi:hypothetical protein